MKIQRGVTIFMTGALMLGASACNHHEKLQTANVEAHTVTRVIDGDTFQLSDGKRVRLIGVDTPERGCPGFLEAKKNLEDLVLTKRIVLVSDGKQESDRYGRLLRYAEAGSRDVGLEQIKDGLADARYDSKDKYPKHSREDKYHKADKEKNPVCQNK
jgi:endonuclease YncB( thermonuclease family)